MWMIDPRLWRTLAVCCVVPMLTAVAAEPFTFHHENVLGTGLELRVLADSETAATQAESAALAEIDRLAMVLSTYDPGSELSRWTRSGAATELSHDLCAVLRASDRWRIATRGAFHPGAELFSQMWRRAERTGIPPTETERRQAALSMSVAPWEWTGADAARFTGRYSISLNAIAKGAILEESCRRMQRQPGVTGAMVKLGGDLRVMGELTAAIDIHPPTDSLTPPALLDRVSLHDRALATSSGAFRGATIDGRRYSHLIDPRTGQPVDHVPSATVIAPHAADADALATACSVLSVTESLALVDSLADTACLLLDADGRRHRSRNWPTADTLALAMAEDAQPPAWNGGMELAVTFAINQPADGPRYRRPYVAVWVEDANGRAVRTLVLWVQTGGPGPKWIPDLKRWYRSDRLRRQTSDRDLIRTVSEATRKPGEYTVTWNGLDDAGQLVPPGEYTVFLEAAREHGTYQLLRKPIVCRDRPVQHTLEGNAEIKSATVDYRKPVPSAKGA
jgi:thiamine biosynthesis lipoprotein ApbE